MTTFDAAAQAASTAPLSLAEVRDRILADEALPLDRRRDLASALLQLAKALGVPADILPADPVALRGRLKGLTPKMVGHKAPRWKNILSLTRTALLRVGICVISTRFDHTPSAAWIACLDLRQPAYGGYSRDQKDQDRRLLGRFARYCTLFGIEPADVDDSVLAQFLHDLEFRSLVDDFNRAARDTAVRWNQVAEAVPEWPQQRLTVADNRNIYAVPWDAFPASLKLDVDSWLARLADGGDLTNEGDGNFKPLRPASIVLRRKQMHLYVSALVLKGEDPLTMVDLAAVVTRPRVNIGLQFLLDRKGEKRSLHATQVAGMLLAVARHWVKAPAGTIKGIINAVKKVRPDVEGMTEHNETLLRQLDPERLWSLLTLPLAVLAEAKKEPPNLSMARQMQVAAMVEILLKAPIRMKNLTELKVGENLLTRSNGEMVLVLPGRQTKNRQPIQTRLRGRTVQVLHRYLTVDRPLLAQPTSPYVFPGKTADCPKSQDGLRVPMKACLAKRCGLAFHPHLFRHLAGHMILDDSIEALPVVQQVLGHKRIDTTEKFYTSCKSGAAYDHLDSLVERLREDPQPKPSRPNGKKGGK